MVIEPIIGHTGWSSESLVTFAVPLVRARAPLVGTTGSSYSSLAEGHMHNQDYHNDSKNIYIRRYMVPKDVASIVNRKLDNEAPKWSIRENKCALLVDM